MFRVLRARTQYARNIHVLRATTMPGANEHKSYEQLQCSRSGNLVHILEYCGGVTTCAGHRFYQSSCLISILIYTIYDSFMMICGLSIYRVSLCLTYIYLTYASNKKQIIRHSARRADALGAEKKNILIHTLTHSHSVSRAHCLGTGAHTHTHTQFFCTHAQHEKKKLHLDDLSHKRSTESMAAAHFRR